MRPSTTTHSNAVHQSLLTIPVSLFEKWSKQFPRRQALPLAASADYVYETSGQKGIKRSSLLLASQVLLPLASTIGCGQASSGDREMAALVS
jgi:hypothetical protein